MDIYTSIVNQVLVLARHLFRLDVECTSFEFCLNIPILNQFAKINRAVKTYFESTSYIQMYFQSFHISVLYVVLVKYDLLWLYSVLYDIRYVFLGGVCILVPIYPPCTYVFTSLIKLLKKYIKYKKYFMKTKLYFWIFWLVF